jgi:hypothetical protein
LGKRQADEVGMLDDEAKDRFVVVGERGEMQVAVGKVDALAGPHLRPARCGRGDPDVGLAGSGGDDRTPDLAVVEEDPIADGLVVEHLREGAADPNTTDAGRALRCVGHLRLVAGVDIVAVGSRGRQVGAQCEDVVTTEDEGLFGGRDVADDGGTAVGRDQTGPGEVRGVVDLDTHADRAGAGDDHCATGIAQSDAVAWSEKAQPPIGYRYAGRVVRRVRRRRALVLGHEDSPRRCRRPSQDVSPGTQSTHPRSCLDRSGAQFRAGEVDENRARSLRRRGGPPQVGHHVLPGIRVVVGAVDPGAVHAVGEEVLAQFEAAGRLARHGDQDARGPAGPARTEEGLGVGFERHPPPSKLTAASVRCPSPSPASMCRVARTRSSVVMTCSSARPSDDNPSSASDSCNARKSWWRSVR